MCLCLCLWVCICICVGEVFSFFYFLFACVRAPYLVFLGGILSLPPFHTRSLRYYPKNRHYHQQSSSKALNTPNTPRGPLAHLPTLKHSPPNARRWLPRNRSRNGQTRPRLRPSSRQHIKGTLSWQMSELHRHSIPILSFHGGGVVWVVCQLCAGRYGECGA